MVADFSAFSPSAEMPRPVDLSKWQLTGGRCTAREKERVRVAWESLRVEKPLCHSRRGKPSKQRKQSILRPVTAPSGGARGRTGAGRYAAGRPGNLDRGLGLAPLHSQMASSPRSRRRPSTTPVGVARPAAVSQHHEAGNKGQDATHRSDGGGAVGLVKRLQALKTDPILRESFLQGVDNLIIERRRRENNSGRSARHHQQHPLANSEKVLQPGRAVGAVSRHEMARLRRQALEDAMLARVYEKSEEARQARRAEKLAKQQSRESLMERQRKWMHLVEGVRMAQFWRHHVLYEHCKKREDAAARKIQCCMRRFARAATNLRVINAFGSIGAMLALRASTWARKRLDGHSDLLRSLLVASKAWSLGSPGFLKLRLAIGRIHTVKRAVIRLQRWWRHSWRRILCSLQVAELRWLDLEDTIRSHYVLPPLARNDGGGSGGDSGHVREALVKQVSLETGISPEIRRKIIRGFLRGKRIRQQKLLAAYIQAVILRMTTQGHQNIQHAALKKPYISTFLAAEEVRCINALCGEYMEYLVGYWDPQKLLLEREGGYGGGDGWKELEEPSLFACRVARDWIPQGNSAA